MKDEGFNMNIMIFTLKTIKIYDILGLKESYQGTYFGHAFSKACYYAATNKFFVKI